MQEVCEDPNKDEATESVEAQQTRDHALESTLGPEPTTPQLDSPSGLDPSSIVTVDIESGDTALEAATNQNGAHGKETESSSESESL